MFWSKGKRPTREMSLLWGKRVFMERTWQYYAEALHEFIASQHELVRGWQKGG